MAAQSRIKTDAEKTRARIVNLHDRRRLTTEQICKLFDAEGVVATTGAPISKGYVAHTLHTAKREPAREVVDSMRDIENDILNAASIPAERRIEILRHLRGA